MKWIANRAGLLNFWYYDEETFDFQNGRLLLRGTNGSGKSVTMQSLFPVLLDGKKTPKRLDSFGSQARKMEDYLLGEKEVVDRDERTGYLFIEYKKAGMEQYVTTGIGMQAKRNKGIKSWYFVLTDNRRIGHDFQLAQTIAGEKVPLSAKELENRIGTGGYVVHTQREYMELVNKHVFGFQTIEAYEDLIELLIQLRSPKLSKDFKPTVIYEILESALPPLTDDELRHLSDTIESMDQAQQQLDQLEREYEANDKLKKSYDTYNQFMLVERAQKWADAQRTYQETEQAVQTYETNEQVLIEEVAQLQKDQQHHEQQQQVLEAEKSSLQTHEVWKLEENKTAKQKDALEVQQEMERLQNKWAEHNKKLHNTWKEKEAIEIERDEHQKQLKEMLEELAIDAQEAAFHQHDLNVADYTKHTLGEFDFTVWQQESKKHQGLLTALNQLALREQLLKERYNDLQRQSSEKQHELDMHQKDLNQLLQWFESERQKLTTEVFQWIETHSKLQYAADLRQDIARSLQGLYDNNRFDIVRNQLMLGIHTYEASLNKEIITVETAMENKKQEISFAEVELSRLQMEKMIEPERTLGAEQFRQQLTEDGQDFVPFYAAVEFQDHVTDEQKERIEAVLKKVGILDSVISNQSIVPEQDSVLLPAPRVLGHTLADFLQADVDEGSTISKALVDDVLRSIPLDKEDGQFFIDDKGFYAIGCLVGHAPNEGTSKFIGRTSRKRHQREQIQLWTQRLDDLQNDLATLQIELTNLQQQLSEANGWKQQLPQDTLLADLQQQISLKQFEMKTEQQQLNRIDEQWKTVHAEWNEVKKQLREQGHQLNIALTQEEIMKALTAANAYHDRLSQLTKVVLMMSHTMKTLVTIAERIEELQDELDHVQGESNMKQSRLELLRAEIQSIEQQLQLQGIDEVRKRIRDVQTELKVVAERLEDIRKTLPRKEAEQENNANHLEMKKRELTFWRQMTDEWATMLKQEVDYGFCPVDAVDAKAILQQYEAVIAKKYERSRLLEQLSKTYNSEQSNLTEYRMTDYTQEFETPAWFAEDFGDYLNPYKGEWHQLKGRRLIQMEYRGQRVSPYFVGAALQQELEAQKGWLDEQDRQLYEDIIVNTVGTILRRRIQRAEAWVKEMDKIMASRDNSSGLIFSIAWKPLTAESEQELDTKDLVQLLQRNSKFLSEDDLSKITKHFQSRIMRAKELIQLRNEGTTLHQVLKEVLDYRKWFTFVLSYSRTNEPKRELTNNAFFKFSGGEKAMAMYIPLFTAAYSRYKEADDMAPYIISLDEAFAGVDELNIRDMFEVVEQLGFNYLMNSQALWGDYDTISNLSIAELVRPKNADYVTVIRYRWDGKKRSLVIGEDTV